MRRLFKKLFFSALVIFCAPLGFHHAQGGHDREANDKANAAETFLSREADIRTYTSSESLEISAARDEDGVARQLRMIPLASYVLFLKEYSEIEE